MDDFISDKIDCGRTSRKPMKSCLKRPMKMWIWSRRTTNDERRRFVNAVLKRDYGEPHDLDRISRELRGEAKARVRRIRDDARISIEDVAAYSNLLKTEFPELVYFFPSYKSNFLTPYKLSDNFPIQIFDNLLDATNAALEIAKLRLPLDGFIFLRPKVIARWPWPEEQASGDPEELIGRREFPDQVFDVAIQYRALGRWFMLECDARGYVFPRKPTAPRDEWRLDEVQRPDQVYWPFQMLDAGQSLFFTLYDFNDPETTAFAKRTHALWRRIYTSKIAHYDPATGEVVHPENWDEKFPWKIGKQALAGALASPKRYAGFAPRTAPGGGRLLLGPAPKARKK